MCQDVFYLFFTIVFSGHLGHFHCVLLGVELGFIGQSGAGPGEGERGPNKMLQMLQKD